MAHNRSPEWRRRDANRQIAEAIARHPENMLVAGRTLTVSCTRTGGCGHKAEVDLLALVGAGRGKRDVWFQNWTCSRCKACGVIEIEPPVSGLRGWI